LPGGLRVNNGEFAALGLASYWWCSTKDEPEARFVGYYDGGVERGSNKKQFGLSVRCIMCSGETAIPDASALNIAPVIIAQKTENPVSSVAYNQQKMVTIRNEAFRFELTAPEGWEFIKIAQQDPYEEMKSGNYSTSISTSEGDKVPENWNGFKLSSTGPLYDACPFLIIYAHRIGDQKPEDFAKLFESSLTSFGIKDSDLNRNFSVGDATGFDCIYGVGLKIRYTALYRNGIRIVIQYYFPSSDPSLFDRYAPEVDKVIQSVKIK
jgi:hypothetical protein